MYCSIYTYRSLRVAGAIGAFVRFCFFHLQRAASSFTQFHIDDKQDTRYKTIISKNNDIKHLRTNFMLHKSARVLPFENVCGTMTVCGTCMFMVFYIEEFEC